MSEENMSIDPIEPIPQEELTPDAPSEDLGSGNVEFAVKEESSLKGPIEGEEAKKVDEIIEKGIEDGKSQNEIKSMVREFRLKVNGEETVEKYDFDNELDVEALKKELQLAKAGQKAMQQRAELENVLKSEIERLKSDPWSVLEELGHDPLKLATERLTKQVEYDELSQEDKLRLDYEKKVAEIDAREKELERRAQMEEQRKKDEEFSKQQKAYQSQIMSEMDTEIEKAKLPNDKITRDEIVNQMVWLRNEQQNPDSPYFNKLQGLNINPALVMPNVIKNHEEMLKNHLSRLDEDYLYEKILEKKTLEKRRNAILDKVPNPSKMVAFLALLGAIFYPHLELLD